jgi:hypothetical protein
MANFEETRFLGLTPRAIGLTLVAGAIVVGLFFIPETVKMLFDGKAKSPRDKVASMLSSKQPVSKKSDSDSSTRAALSKSALKTVNTDSDKSAGDAKLSDIRVSKRAQDSDESRSGSKGGFFSGWDFQVKARDWGKEKSAQVPANMTFDRLLSRDGANFIKGSKGAIPRFLKQEGFSGGVADEGIQPLREALSSVISGDSKGASSQEIADKLKSAHIQALKGIRTAGGDRGAMLRWLEVPVIKFIDTRSGINAADRLRETFNPALVLDDLSVRQRKGGRGWGGSGINPVTFRASFAVSSSDVEKVVAYSNGRVVRSFKIQRARFGEPKQIRLQGDAGGVWTIVAYDSFGARPYAKSYSFYPKASVFGQSRDGSYQIGFLPGSGRNSLDRFFLVGATKRRQSSDSSISTF